MTKRIITTKITDLVQIKIKCKLLSAVYLFLLKSKLDSVVYIHVFNIFKLGLMEKALTLTEKKRLSILAAAQEEFKEKGFLGASMDSLAKRAEVSKRTVYNHFPSKDILFHNIVMLSLPYLQNVTKVRNVRNDAKVITLDRTNSPPM